MPENNKQFLDENGLQRYHNGVMNALKDKAAKEHVHVGSAQPTDPNITVWFDTGGKVDGTIGYETFLLSRCENIDENLVLNNTPKTIDENLILK